MRAKRPKEELNHMETNTSATELQLPRWKCHKEVRAFKITGINIPPDQIGHVRLSGNGIEIEVTVEYMKKHRPQVGGFYVLYEDGYHSFSPSTAFESGYISTHVVFYGPHACSQCGILICKMGREYGSETYTYPEGPVYPNSDWDMHICQQRDIEHVNGEVIRLLRKAQERGINLDTGSPVEKLTIAQLDDMLI